MLSAVDRSNAPAWFLTAGMLLLIATPAQSKGLEAHEHGVAHLTLAQEGQEVSVSFTAAADSVIGYEHAPTNDEEWDALYHAEEVLYHPERWLTFPVRCEMETRTVSLPFLSVDGHNARHHAEEHDHDDKHNEEQHDHENKSGHVDIEASYTFHCDGDQATPVELNLFSQLPYLELLRIEAVSERTVVVTEREGDGSLDW